MANSGDRQYRAGPGSLVVAPFSFTISCLQCSSERRNCFCRARAERVLWNRLGRKKLSEEICWVGGLEGVVGFQFWGVYFEKMMRGRSLRLGCLGRKEEEGELFPHSSRGCLSHCLFKDSDFRRGRGNCLDYLTYLYYQPRGKKANRETIWTQ